MLKEIEHWLKRAANGLRSNALEGFSAGGSGTTALRKSSAEFIDFDQ